MELGGTRTPERLGAIQAQKTFGGAARPTTQGHPSVEFADEDSRISSPCSSADTAAALDEHRGFDAVDFDDHIGGQAGPAGSGADGIG